MRNEEGRELLVATHAPRPYDHLTKGLSMSIEFFRSEINRPLDADGHELEPWSNPFFIIPHELEPDDDQADDDAWPDGYWTIGPDEHFEPSPEDWQDYQNHLDREEASHGCNARFA
jgi:hypothetical protein